MDPVLPDCPHCRARQFEAVEGEQRCRACGGKFAFYAFRPPTRRAAVPVAALGRTPCHQHPLNSAVAACDRCGSFLCQLCETRVEGRILCPACFERLHERHELVSTRREQIAWGRLVMVLGALAWFPFYGCLFGLFAIGVGVYAVVRIRRDSSARGKPWVYAGMTIALLGIVLWSVALGAAFWNGRRQVRALRARVPPAGAPTSR